MFRADRPGPAALICAAVALILTLILAATPALAQWREGRGEEGRRGGRGEAMQERAPRVAPRPDARGGGRGYDGGGYDGSPPRYAARPYQGRPYQGQAYQSQAYQGQAYDGQAYRSQAYRGQALRGSELRDQPLRGQPFRGQAFQGGAPYGGYPPVGPPAGDGRAWRRGQVLPDGYRAATVPDPGRYHLRRAPNGYDWVGDNRNAYLMQRSTGMVLDSVPGAYDPPPPYQGRRRR